MELDTNSLGLADQEYAKEKPPETRRVAWIGDSLSRGLGVGVAERFESRLEQRLNQETQNTAAKQFEILNFSVDGYRITQLYYMALEQAPAFHPDVYVLALTQLSVAPNWGAHLAQLVQDGQDLRFDFLRQVVKDSRLQPDDRDAEVEAKLAPYRLPVLREILTQIQSSVDRQGAQLIVVLLPAVEDPREIQWRFKGIPDLVESLDITLVDLLDSFDSVRDIESVRRHWSDLHPSARGHQLLADNLYRKLHQQPRTWSAFVGAENPAAETHPPEVAQAAVH